MVVGYQLLALEAASSSPIFLYGLGYPVAMIKAIKHPVGGGEAPAFSLIDKAFLTADAARENFTLTPKAKDFLAYDPKPEFEEASAGGAEEPAE